MYNFMLAFLLCCLVYIIGEVVSNLTKAWIPSVFVSAVVMLVGYWTVFPHDLVTTAGLIPFGSTICCYLQVAHMGTMISLQQLARQWKVIIICLFGLTGMTALALLICPMVMDRSFVIAGLPPLAGGVVAATIMQQAAAAKGLKDATVFAIVMYCMKGFVGYPLTAVCLQLGGRKMLKEFRTCKRRFCGASGVARSEVNGTLEPEKSETRRKLLPPLPAKYNSNVVIFAKLALTGWIATMLAKISFPGIGKVSGLAWVLVLSVILTHIGFLDEDAMNKCNAYGIVMFAIMMFIFDGLKDCTIEMLGSIVAPMILLIVIGVAGMAVLAFMASKVLYTSFALSFATALTALYGFPMNAIITESTCSALAETEEEKNHLMDQMFTPMIVGGFITVTITSVLVAGVFANIL